MIGADNLEIFPALQKIMHLVFDPAKPQMLSERFSALSFLSQHQRAGYINKIDADAANHKVPGIVVIYFFKKFCDMIYRSEE